uniref:Uncharacterized protein n=1 Tax=Solanum tuberosum TaxID=4113 RepID=M1A7K2_SOLTU
MAVIHAENLMKFSQRHNFRRIQGLVFLPQLTSVTGSKLWFPISIASSNPCLKTIQLIFLGV